jgi:uncharacterized membrane protein YphA (DoxX/SURF4 family)
VDESVRQVSGCLAASPRSHAHEEDCFALPRTAHFRLAAMYFMVYLCIFAFGPGKFSLDHLLRNKA